MNLRISIPGLFGVLLMAVASAPALAVKPFSANYTAHYMGMQGAGKMTIAPAGENRWKYTMAIDSKIAKLSQSTVFEDNDGQWRPVSGSDSSLLLIKKADKQATYDWARGEARWTGDVKPERAGPVKLQAGDLDAMLVNLAVARDAMSGKPMNYRMVDNGRVKQMSYTIVGKEEVSIGGKARQATKVSHTDGDKQYLAWVVEGVPVPVRILQREDGKDQIDLRISSLN